MGTQTTQEGVTEQEAMGGDRFRVWRRSMDGTGVQPAVASASPGTVLLGFPIGTLDALHDPIPPLKTQPLSDTHTYLRMPRENL